MTSRSKALPQPKSNGSDVGGLTAATPASFFLSDGKIVTIAVVFARKAAAVFFRRVCWCRTKRALPPLKFRPFFRKAAAAFQKHAVFRGGNAPLPPPHLIIYIRETALTYKGNRSASYGKSFCRTRQTDYLPWQTTPFHMANLNILYRKSHGLVRIWLSTSFKNSRVAGHKGAVYGP